MILHCSPVGATPAAPQSIHALPWAIDPAGQAWHAPAAFTKLCCGHGLQVAFMLSAGAGGGPSQLLMSVLWRGQVSHRVTRWSIVLAGRPLGSAGNAVDAVFLSSRAS